MRLIYILILSFLALGLNAQNKKEFSCDFVQSKKSAMFAEDMVSRGKMYYCPLDKVRWEYTAPVHTIFIMNGENALVVADGKKKNVDMGKNGLYRSIADIISAGTNVETDARYEVEKDGNTLIMKPLRKDMKRLFTSVTIVLGPEGFPKSVLISERNGDSTVIDFMNIDTSKIASSVFEY